MQCVNCHNAITPGMEIELPSGADSLWHCPYCLHLLPTPPVADAEERPAGAANVSVERFERRRRVREQFVDRLIRSSADGALHCPGCNCRLNKNDELALRSAERFCCQQCQLDLAEHAYRQVAYDQSHWLPVIAALSQADCPQDCADCTYRAAVASACQRALACMPQPQPQHQELLAALLSRTSWRVPDCDWSESCAAAKEYRKRAAEGIALL